MDKQTVEFEDKAESAGHRYLDYSEFWRISMEKIEEIQGKLNSAVMQLEKKYSGFDEIYSLIEEELNTLSSIYSSYNSIDGGNHVLKLNSLIREYKRRYTRDGIDFELIHFLLRKIGELRDSSVDNFPLLKHRDKSTGVPVYREVEEKKDYLNRPFKWVTYERNRSWFISRFSNILILNASDTEDNVREDDDYIILKYNGKEFRAFDHFGSTTSEKQEVKYFIIIDDGEKVYAATTVGSRLYAKKDLLEGKVEPFKHPHSTTLYSGYVRVFGKKHIHVV